MANVKGIAIGIGVAIAAAGIAYGVGRYQGEARVTEAEQRALSAGSASSAAVLGSKVSVDVERGKVARLEARRRMHLALIALDDRNFGTAQEHVTIARSWLASAKGADVEVLKLGADLEAFKVVASEDVGEQRTKMIALCKRLDDLLPPGKP